MATKTAFAHELYGMGKTGSNWGHRSEKPKSSPGNIEEKLQRLTALRKRLPSEAREKLDPVKLAQHLTNREESTLEHCIRVRFNQSLSDPPTWATEEAEPITAA